MNSVHLQSRFTTEKKHVIANPYRNLGKPPNSYNATQSANENTRPRHKIIPQQQYFRNGTDTEYVGDEMQNKTKHIFRFYLQNRNGINLQDN